ncbi:hypothetical protein B0I35DRAFT_226217 [Stachybotrys elegans]|uniref:Secreted protein n=1 Tax=Stachybotrys elegans TaxID=80388 RepID=A0A8K0ST96_9HYPO|nr:hypothetical protein B0I35DRAFT_226217 [Stachybotrys elegans]
MYIVLVGVLMCRTCLGIVIIRDPPIHASTTSKSMPTNASSTSSYPSSHHRTSTLGCGLAYLVWKVAHNPTFYSMPCTTRPRHAAPPTSYLLLVPSQSSRAPHGAQEPTCGGALMTTTT